MSSPLVSILIPTFNRSELLKLTLFSALNQTYENIEILIGDNASDDNTQRYLSEINDPMLRVFRHPRNIGMVGNWNFLIQASRGDFFVILSDDDLLAPNTIECLVCAMLEIGDSPFSFCSISLIDEEGVEIVHREAPNKIIDCYGLIDGFLLGDYFPYLCGILFSREYFTSFVRLEESLCTNSIDALSWMKLAIKAGFAVSTNKTRAYYRIHLSSETSLAHVDRWIDDFRLLKYEVSKILISENLNVRRVHYLKKNFDSFEALSVISHISRSPRRSLRDISRNVHALFKRKELISYAVGYPYFFLSLGRQLLPDNIERRARIYFVKLRKLGLFR